jgi:predicted house-cleaning noncanonical NTP pyrophosphatase (MazG superfamily)
MTDLTPAPNGYPIKLVRDKTTDIIGDEGRLFYDRISFTESVPWLRKKLVEEVAEYIVAPAEDELADVLAVVQALAHVHGKDLTTLTALMNADPRGGFFTGRMMRGHHPNFDGEPEQGQ